MVSVCIASHNGEKYIKTQISSILAQLDNNDELIISDDGSTDATLDIVKGFNDSRIKLISYKQDDYIKDKRYCRSFYYASYNFENALKQAKGEYIFLSDQDDIWNDNKKEEMLLALVSNDIVMSNFSIIDAKGEKQNDQYYAENPISSSIIKNVISCHFLGCCMAFNRKVLDYVLPFPKNLIGHDLWIGSLGCHNFTFSFIEKPLHQYRRSGDNVSAATESSKNPLYFKIYYRVRFLAQLVRRIYLGEK